MVAEEMVVAEVEEMAAETGEAMAAAKEAVRQAVGEAAVLVGRPIEARLLTRQGRRCGRRAAWRGIAELRAMRQGRGCRREGA